LSNLFSGIMPSKTFVGQYTSLAPIADFYAQAAQEAGFDSKDTYAVKLAVDEACSNIIEHGYSEEKGAEICCSYEVLDEGLKIIIQDWGRPFMPDEIPDSALATVMYRGLEGEEIRSVKVGFKNLQTRGPDQDRPCSHFRFSRGNVIQHNVIGHGAEKLFTDALIYITATAYGEPNQVIENYIYKTGIELPHPSIPFRLIYIDGFSGDFVFARNFAFDSRFRFEVVAPYAWWGRVDNRSNIFYNVKAAEEEYFGGDNEGFGNICVRYGSNDPQLESLADYNRMVYLLESDDWNGPEHLPGSKKIKKKLTKIIKSIK